MRTWSILGKDLIYKILSKLNDKDLSRVACACKAFKIYIGRRDFWTYMCAVHFGIVRGNRAKYAQRYYRRGEKARLFVIDPDRLARDYVKHYYRQDQYAFISSTFARHLTTLVREDKLDIKDGDILQIGENVHADEWKLAWCGGRAIGINGYLPSIFAYPYYPFRYWDNIIVSDIRHIDPQLRHSFAVDSCYRFTFAGESFDIQRLSTGTYTYKMMYDNGWCTLLV